MVNAKDVSRSVAKLLAELAQIGSPYLVGGCVVDMLRAVVPKDWDIEVYNVHLPVLEEALAELGLTFKRCGKGFGILKIAPDCVGGLDVDVSIPRRENRVGVGHADFEVIHDPGMTPKEGAERRDLTINSVYWSPDGGFQDPYEGLKDLQAGVLRATNPEKFVEDALRPLRIMQFLARGKGKTVDAETMELCRQLSGECVNLSKERVFEEFKKLLMADDPVTGLRFLVDSGWIANFPELADLVGCEQHPEWHPEGDVWEHTLWAVKNAAILRSNLPKDWQLAYMFGVLLHDVGKPSTTAPDLTAYGHDQAGGPIAKSCMKRVTDEKKLIIKVTAIVENHMQPYSLTAGGGKAAAWRRLHNKIRLDVIGWMSRADGNAKPGRDCTDPNHEPSKLAFEYFAELGEEKIAPLVQGRDLIKAGLKPGPKFGKALKVAYEAQVADSTLGLDDLLQVALATI